MLLATILLGLALFRWFQTYLFEDNIGVDIEEYIKLDIVLLFYYDIYRDYLEESTMFDTQLGGKEEDWYMH